MSWKCEVCSEVAPKQTPLRRFLEYRPDKSILRERTVCPSCDAELRKEVTLPILLSRFRREKPPLRLLPARPVDGGEDVTEG